MIYLDNASTSYVYEDCIKDVTDILENAWGNPSNVYSFGDEPKHIIEQAKEDIAEIIGCKSNEIFFTSGASEGNSWAIAQRDKVFCSKYEHHNYLENEKVTTIDEDLIGLEPNSVYAHMLVSNETGELFDVKPLFLKAKTLKCFTVCDCTQAFGNIKLNVKDLGCDMAVFSGHKFHAPKGVGFVYISEEVQPNIKPLITGTQQSGLRGGTQNVAYIKALATAVKKSYSELNMKIEASLTLKSYIYKTLVHNKIDFIEIKHNSTIATTYSIALANVESEILQSVLSEKDIFIGTGSGCANGLMEPNATLVAMNIPDKYISGLIRFSFSLANTLGEVETAVDELIKAYRELTE